MANSGKLNKCRPNHTESRREIWRTSSLGTPTPHTFTNKQCQSVFIDFHTFASWVFIFYPFGCFVVLYPSFVVHLKRLLFKLIRVRFDNNPTLTSLKTTICVNPIKGIFGHLTRLYSFVDISLVQFCAWSRHSIIVYFLVLSNQAKPGCDWSIRVEFGRKQQTLLTCSFPP